MDVADSDDEFSLDPGGERETDEAALRAALHFSVGEICSAETSGKPMSGAAVSTLSEVSGQWTDRRSIALLVQCCPWRYCGVVIIAWGH